MTVVEFLTFDVAPADRDDWLHNDEAHWTRFLERQPGFVAKQIWIDPAEPAKVHAAIWWESNAQWKAIADEDLAAVAGAMGQYERSGSLATYEVVREHRSASRSRPPIP